MTTESDVETMNALIGLCEDAVEVFHDAVDAVSSTALKLKLSELENTHAAAAGALKRMVLESGAEPRERGTVAGTVNRLLADLKSKVAAEELEPIAGEVQRLQQVVLAAFHEALGKELSPEVRTLVAQHAGELEAADRARAPEC